MIAFLLTCLVILPYTILSYYDQYHLHGGHVAADKVS